MKFSVTLDIEVEEGSHILSSSPKDHEEDVNDFIKDVFYDIDDIRILDVETLKLKQR